MSKDHLKALEAAIELFPSKTEFARACGVSRQIVSNWVHREKQVTSKHVLSVEKATRGKITRYDLRPDFYPRDIYNVFIED